MADKQFIDISHAKIYSEFRKDNPEELIRNIISHLKEEFSGPLKSAVDVGCGSGQSSAVLSPFFDQVYGLDISEAQIKNAESSRSFSNVKYLVNSSEKLPFEDGSVQLISAATCLHWFDLDKFFPEAQRVLCDKGVLAAYGYAYVKPLLEDKTLSSQIDQLYDDYYNVLRPYMLPQAYSLKDRYKDINFPFEDVRRPDDYRQTFEGYLSEVVGYANTFSGFQNFLKADKKKAEECISSFKSRLYNIVASSNVSSSEKIMLYRDYVWILCRKSGKL